MKCFYWKPPPTQRAKNVLKRAHAPDPSIWMCPYLPLVVNTGRRGAQESKWSQFPSPKKEDLLTRIQDHKGKPRKLKATPILLHSDKSPASKNSFQRGIQKRDSTGIELAYSCYRKCGNSEALDTSWKSAMEPISLGNNQQKQEKK